MKQIGSTLHPSFLKRYSGWFILFFFALSFINVSTLQSRRLNFHTLTKDALPEVIRCAKGDDTLDAEYQSKCIDLLGRWKEPSAKSAITSVLSKKGEDALHKRTKEYIYQRDLGAKARVAACYALAEIGGADTIAPIVTTLKEDYSATVRVAAAYVLQLYQEESAVDGLIDALLLEIQKNRNASYPVAKQIVRSLGVIGHKKAFIPLLKATQVSFPDDVKEDAQVAIERIKW